MRQAEQLLDIRSASEWASRFVGKAISPSNISYLIQYGRIRKIGENGSTRVSENDLREYYNSYKGSREINFKKHLGEDLNWALSFDQYTESETTKHVHRLHPYKGKFIPQLVEYFLDEHTDKFKTETYFEPGDIVLDPFSGSGTTMVQASELGMHAIGIDVSAFNAMIGNCKVARFDMTEVCSEIARITEALEAFIENSNAPKFEEELLHELNVFNNEFFPVPDYKFKLRKGQINEKEYGKEKEKQFLPIYKKLVKEYKIQLLQKEPDTFLDKWYTKHIRNEIAFVFEKIKEVKTVKTKKILALILSRTMRSCRATTHSDLATLIEPVTTTYYCHKHGKICKPLFSILKWWKTYSKDTVLRLKQFEQLRSDTYQYCLTGDSRTIDIVPQLKTINENFAKLIKKQKIKGIFTSPPYVGMIDYHEQHAYAYDLFGFERRDELEIGPLFKGQGKEAKESYIDGISQVLINCKKYLADDYNVFLVANDKYNMYPIIAQTAGMQIVKQFRRPVLNRTEKDKAAYSETIFHLKTI